MHSLLAGALCLARAQTPRCRVDRLRPEHFLPLTPVAFDVLLALADGEQHGYRIMQDVNARAGAGIPLRTGTLYRALARLLEQGLIDELPERPADVDERRRYYCLTALGIAVARAEMDRLASQVDVARQRRLLGERS